MALPQREFPNPPPAPIQMARRRPIPWFSGAVIGVSAARFLATSLAGSERWSLYGPAVQAGEWWRLLAYAVEHGGVLHIVMNMSVVYTLGFGLERLLGTWRFAVISLVGCLGSAAFALWFNFDTPTVGASGMIISWAGAMLPIANRATRQSLLIWLVQIAVISFLPFVSWAGHLGGLVFGLPCGLALRAGPRAFPYLAPILVFVAAAAAVAVAAGHPMR